MADTLFDLAPTARPEPGVKLSADRRRTLRQAEILAAGWHPLGPAAGHLRVKLHPQAAPADDRAAAGRRCGNCRFRRLLSGEHAGRFPKCTFGDDMTRATNSAASDCRAWWPGCRDHEYGEPGLSADAARWVPAAVA